MHKNVVFRLVVMTAVLFLVFTLRLYTVSPPSVDPEHAFNSDQAFSRLVRLLDDEAPHPVDSVSNDAVRERLLTEIRALGFSPIVRDDFHCSEGRQAMRCAQVQNILFWVGEAGPNAVMIASHYDSVPAGPGAGDDGAGVAASLEIASLLKGRALARPVLVLITDGEEIGLVGAASFVAKDPVAKLVSAVVSMEARGVSGPVAMFQTSTPNGRDIAAMQSDIKTASTNSLAADVYQRMPNGTDVTQFLKLGIDANNFAIGGSPEFYHTPRDNLAMLDQRSFFHMGVSALNTVEALLAQSGDEPEQQWIYADVLGLSIISLPQVVGMPLIIFGGLMALAVFVVKGAGSPVRALAFPFLAILLGVSFAVAASFSVDAMRPESHYAAAHPWALRATQHAAALLGALLAFMLIGRSIAVWRLLASSWFCLALLGGVLSFFFPGAAILFVPALLTMTVAALLVLINKQRLASILSVLAALLFSLLVVPTSALAEMMLFPEYAAPFTVFLVFCFLLFVPHVLPADGYQEKRAWGVSAAGGSIVLLLVTVATLVPAYSPDAPRGLSIIQAAENGSDDAKFVAFTDDLLPAAMLAVTPFERGSVAGFDDEAYVAPAPSFATEGVEVRIESDEIVADERLLVLKVTAPDSDIITGRVKPKAVIVNSMTLNGIASADAGTSRFSCHGRQCRSFTLSLSVSRHETDVSLQVNGFRYGLGNEGQRLLQARPDSVLPRSWGDLRVVSNTVELR
ncbi:M20/M25/M40 family metallo-hydrolase [Arenicella xantha]|uniref:Peptidase M28-like protein n=1 Tax=Arenicella xantha TaxID=644221 RepID=A0A395JK41_9GAMM|nr:M20/M25/M40 family metallo-hydrolase [Arenicella xantha]RBP51051.1 peptidase M28-like protein [Arenicella xantha]